MHKVGLNEMLDFNGTNSELEYVEMDSSKRYGRVSFFYIIFSFMVALHLIDQFNNLKLNHRSVWVLLFQ